MSSTTKDTIQRILLIALAAMTVSMVLVSVFNYKDSQQKNEYLENEKLLVQQELTDIIKNYEHLAKESDVNKKVLNVEKEKVKKLLNKIERSVLDYEEIIEYRKELLALRKSSIEMQRKAYNADQGASKGTFNTTY